MSTYGVSVLGAELATLVDTAVAADRAGFDAAWASEFYSRSGSISMAAMAARTRHCRLGSSILYGVGRSPMVLATEVQARPAAVQEFGVDAGAPDGLDQLQLHVAGVRHRDVGGEIRRFAVQATGLRSELDMGHAYPGTDSELLAQ